MTRDLLFVLSGPALAILARAAIFFAARRDARRAQRAPGE